MTLKETLYKCLYRHPVYTLPLYGGGQGWGWNGEDHTPIPTFPPQGGRGYKCLCRHPVNSLPLEGERNKNPLPLYGGGVRQDNAKQGFAPPNGCTGMCTPDFARSMDSEALKGWGWNDEDCTPIPTFPPQGGRGILAFAGMTNWNSTGLVQSFHKPAPYESCA